MIEIESQDDTSTIVCELTALPFELLEKILSNLTAFEVLRLSKCSSFLRAVALHDQVFSRYLVTSGPLITNDQLSLERLQIPVNLLDLRLVDWVKSPFYSVFRELHVVTEVLHNEEMCLIDRGNMETFVYTYF
jgi:hypothetical protein